MSAIKYKPDEETLRHFNEWLDERPAIRDLVNAAPPWHCYRLKDHNPRGHYSIHAYNEDGTLTIIHGADSTLPGVGAFGYKPEMLTVCDCGKYEFASAERLKASGEYIEALAKERREAN